MIKLFVLEQSLKESNNNDENKLKAISSLKKLLFKVDHDAEYIPINNIGTLIDLFEDLKGEKLDLEEVNVLREIAG